VIYAREYWFSPRLHETITSHVRERTLTNDMKFDEALSIIEKLKEKSDEELGAMVREWLEHPDVQNYPRDFTEWVDEVTIE
tara:strand:+ start:311 stop:553 length:243 start_codon:yes stop_codon:yes gene_type:complete